LALGGGLTDPRIDALAGRRGADPVPFWSLMSNRVRRVLLVSSLYDSYALEEDGSFTELLFSEYLELNLRYAPHIVRVSTPAEALKRLEGKGFDLVIYMLQVSDRSPADFASDIRSRGGEMPLVVLAYSTRELELLRRAGRLEGVDRAFTWQGDARLFLAIVKSVEDRLNAQPDRETAGVKAIILVEDSIRFCSSYLPMLYTELMLQTQTLMTDGVNQMQKLLRMRARPKILLATTFEEGMELFEEFRTDLLGLIVDARFPRGGEVCANAGLELAGIVRRKAPDCPVLVQSSEEENRQLAANLGAAFINKESPTLLAEVRGFMQDYLGFGDFVFRGPDGAQEARASDLTEMLAALKGVSDETLVFHARRNDFSKWLMARTEFELARALRPQRVEDFESPGHMRDYLLAEVRRWRRHYRAGAVEEYSPETFGHGAEFVRIGQGSLGGKGRGLAFFHALMNRYRIADRFAQARIFVPQTAVLATDVFEEFMAANDLYDLVYTEERELGEDPAARDRRIEEAFIAAGLPARTREALASFLGSVDYPLAVRSSSLLEDSPAQPFAGVYETHLIPNDHPDADVRLQQLCTAVKRVWASTYKSDSVSYIDSTPNRLEDERMAVVIQQIVGQRHGDWLYPTVSGVARSYDLYPVEGADPEEGVVCAALGFGEKVVSGGQCVRFSPAKPGRLYGLSSPKDYLDATQRDFLALRMAEECGKTSCLQELELEEAQEHGTLDPVGSTYAAADDRLYPGTFREGAHLVTMAGVLQGDRFPLAGLLEFLLEVGKAGFSCDIEIEFAVNLFADRGHLAGELGFLQIRPMGFLKDPGKDLSDVRPGDTVVLSDKVLGQGSIEGITDIIYVPSEGFDRSLSTEAASDVGRLNARLRREGRKSLLIGPGRWGSADPWLGIPVHWSQISTAACIVETHLPGLDVEPSQGTHFFQNVTSLGIGYFTMTAGNGHLDLEWLQAQHPLQTEGHARLIRLSAPLQIHIDRRSGRGAIQSGA